MKKNVKVEPALSRIFQRYNLKAIHNIVTENKLAKRVEPDISKIQSKSNSQLCLRFTKYQQR